MSSQNVINGDVVITGNATVSGSLTRVGPTIESPVALTSAGTTLGTGTTVTGGNYYVLTLLDGTNRAFTLSATMPVGASVRLYNSDATNGALVFPMVNGTINGASANTGTTLAAHITGTYTLIAAGTLTLAKSA
jgi:hypothetical protein